MTEAELIAALGKRASEGRVPALGIMGGTFDPVHVGHLALADAALSELGLDGMLYMPAGIPSFKRDQRLASPADRVAMVRLAVADRPLSAVSLREVERSGVTYPVDTLEELVPPVSSTLVRERAASQLDIAGLVPPEVERYIFEAGLYGAGARDEWHALDERGV